MNDSKNMILAVVLSALILLGWTWAANKYFPTANPPAAKTQNGQPAPLPQAQGQPAPTAPTAPKALQSRAAVLGSTPRVRIVTPSLQGSLNLKGAQIDDLVLLKQRQTIDKNSPPVRLLSPLGAPGAYVASFGWVGQGAAAPDLNTLWQADSAALTPDRPVTLTTQMPDGTRYEMKIAVDGGYLFTVDQRVINGSGKPVVVRPIGLVSRATKSSDPDLWTNHVGPIGVFDGKANYEVNWKDLDQGKTETFGNVPGWLGFTDHFWLTALVPPGAMTGEFRRSPSGGYQADYALAPTVLAPGQVATTQAKLFAGAKEKAWLDRYEQAGVPKISKSIDWGWFEWFMRPIFGLLVFLFHALGNFGVAIICLTLIVRGIMFPIAQKQFQSMAAMRKIQPKMKALQERYKDDRARQQQEIMKLYQEEKINPAAGCLPILLQIPVFYALYKVLMVSVEMRHQPFVLWIHDLSAPDSASLLTLAHQFGWTWFPPFLGLSVLAFLLGVTMWLQFKLNPQQMDPTQQQIFAIMPWVMMFVMTPFASGLQLYWVTSNVLTILQQWWLYKKYGLHFADTHPVHT
ncbi:MAG TPA: membrane protein insertase YidC [Sphingomicrobium sp.]|nr:membrane protein insertase YidC [Sphingomicrobium sp.]